MPELPEVETTLRGIEPHVSGQQIKRFIVRNYQLRWPIDKAVNRLDGRRILRVSRRGKYILMQLDQGSLIWHLGMSGSMKIQPSNSPVEKHEHVEVQMASGQSLKFKDPRRFGALLYTKHDPVQHALLCKLGPEPLTDEFNADHLFKVCHNRSASIKAVIMDGHLVVGVGNIYACEALFGAGIKPTREAGGISKKRLAKLVEIIKTTLTAAIHQGGTTLQDFTQVDGKPGYFKQELKVYGNKGLCMDCSTKLKQIVQGQRSTYYCPRCQT